MSFRHQYHAHTFSFFSTNPRTNYVWIGHMFGGAVFECVDFSKWIVGEKITERYQICDDPPTGEASAVYHCLQVLGSDVGREGIMKIRMQCVVSPPICFSVFNHFWVGLSCLLYPAESRIPSRPTWTLGIAPN
jgi:hypothetical protein